MNVSSFSYQLVRLDGNYGVSGDGLNELLEPHEHIANDTHAIIADRNRLVIVNFDSNTWTTLGSILLQNGTYVSFDPISIAWGNNHSIAVIAELADNMLYFIYMDISGTVIDIQATEQHTRNYRIIHQQQAILFFDLSIGGGISRYSPDSQLFNVIFNSTDYDENALILAPTIKTDDTIEFYLTGSGLQKFYVNGSEIFQMSISTPESFSSNLSSFYQGVQFQNGILAYSFLNGVMIVNSTYHQIIQFDSLPGDRSIKNPTTIYANQNRLSLLDTESYVHCILEIDDFSANTEENTTNGNETEQPAYVEFLAKYRVWILSGGFALILLVVIYVGFKIRKTMLGNVKNR